MYHIYVLHCRIIHIQPYTYTCGNKINNNYKRIHFFRKICLSHFMRTGCERIMRERWVGDWTNCNILTPNSFVFSSTSFSICWASRSGVLRAHSPLLGAGSLYSILSPTNWLQLSELSVTPGYISLFDTHLLLVCFTSVPNSNRLQSRLYLDIFDAPVIYTGALLIWQLGRGSICYICSRQIQMNIYVLVNDFCRYVHVENVFFHWLTCSANISSWILNIEKFTTAFATKP